MPLSAAERVRGDVLDVFRDHLEYPDLKRKVVELHHRWRRWTSDCKLLIEKKGISLIQDLERQHIRAIAVEPKADKVICMNAQTARSEAKSVVLPQTAPWLDEFRHELVGFPKSRHTDRIDAFSQVLRFRGLPSRNLLNRANETNFSRCRVARDNSVKPPTPDRKRCYAR